VVTQEAGTDTQVTPDAILDVASGFMAAKHLFVASEIGLFSALADAPLSLDELAERTGAPRVSVRIVADAMAALGFVAREGDRYRNEPVSQVFLAGRTPADLRPFLRFWDQISYPAWIHLEEAIRTRRSTFGELSPEQSEIFSRGVEAITAGAAQALAQSYDFSRHRRVLDLGGGTGSHLRILAQRYPELNATLFETPTVAAIARQTLAGTEARERIEVVEGDLFSDPIPVGHDAVLLANVIHLFSPERNRELLSRIRESVAPGTKLLLIDFWTDASHTQPVFAALMAGEFLAVTGEGDSYSVEEVGDWLERTGWTLDVHQPLTGPASLIVAQARAE
jgi:SAM-dependent methyltransferase